MICYFIGTFFFSPFIFTRRRRKRRRKHRYAENESSYQFPDRAPRSLVGGAVTLGLRPFRNERPRRSMWSQVKIRKGTVLKTLPRHEHVTDFYNVFVQGHDIHVHVHPEDKESELIVEQMNWKLQPSALASLHLPSDFTIQVQRSPLGCQHSAENASLYFIKPYHVNNMGHLFKSLNETCTCEKSGTKQQSQWKTPGRQKTCNETSRSRKNRSLLYATSA